MGYIVSNTFFSSIYTHNVDNPLSVFRKHVSVRDISIEDVDFSLLYSA